MPSYVRVKRLASKTPIGSFRAERFFRRSGQKVFSTNFRYIGTQENKVDSVEVNIITPEDVLQKDCTLSWNSEKTAILKQPGSGPISCQIHVRTLKRVKQSDPDPNPSQIYDDDDPPPSKLLRIMEISPKEDGIHLPINLETMTLVEDPKQSSISSTSQQGREGREETQNQQPDFVFDVYKEEFEEPEGSIDTDYRLMKLGYKIHGDDYFVKESNFWYDNDNEEEENKVYCDDDEDSNSESNWRNDYPDEEDLYSSPSHSSSSDSDNSDRTPDDDDDNNYGYYFD